jgi:hypothetical protein
MFPVNTKGVWINYLSGTLGDRHVVDMILGTDGHTFRGVYTMRSSGVSFFIEGQDQNHVLRLVEMNGDQRLSGFLNGKYDGKHFEGQWYNGDQSLTMPLKLAVVNDFNEVTSLKCGQQHWERIFSGKLQSKTIKLHLKRDGLVFHCRFMDSTRVIRDVLVGKGGRVEILTFDFSNTILDGNWLVLDTARLDKLDIVTLDEGGYEVPSSLKLVSTLDYNCYEYADYYARIYGTRPTTGNRKFDVWIEKAFREWAEDSADKLVEQGSNELGTKDRWMLSAEAWVEIGLFSEELISGTIHFQNNVSSALDKKTFIYDLKAGKELAFKDIFESPSMAKDFMDAYVRNHHPGEKMDDREKRWIAKQRFQYMTFTADGVSFKTDFSAIYGEREIILPWQDVKPFFKKNFVLNQVTNR